ncbi:MAG TPA: phosphomethylpyrimidine synthase ThiC, partial [Methanocorpusculum sp.]|nr:phosphomethylpyrimidine synthase ThiC [Methanocorpusculum sp.]
MHSILRDCQAGNISSLTGTAQAEGMTPEALARSIAAGRTILLKNAKRDYTPCAIGEGTKVKVNVNVGTSGQRCDPAMEMEKASAAIANGADAIMDLSTGGDLAAMRREILKLPIPVGTVPIY